MKEIKAKVNKNKDSNTNYKSNNKDRNNNSKHNNK